MTFGRYLLRHGLVSKDALSEATSALVLFGGRLGTHLVERGALSLDALEQHLAKHLGVAVAPPGRLDKPSPEALAALPQSLICRLRVFPFGLARGCLEVATRDPRDRAQQAELASASKLRIRPYLTSEVRLYCLLEKHFGVKRQDCYTRLAPTAAAEPEELPILLLDEVIEATPEERVWQGLREGEELIDPDSFVRLYGSNETHAAGRAPRKGEWLVAGGASAQALERGLAEARDREAVVSHTLALALAHARAVALFAVRGTLQGLSAAGEVATRDLRGVLVAPEPGSLLAGALERGEARGAPRPGGLDEGLARLLRSKPPAELGFFAIRIHERVVNVLYADNGPEPFAEPACGALASLCERVSDAYARIIVERKRRLC